MLSAHKINPQKSQSGMTLVEFLVVIAIIAILLIILLFNSRTHLARSRDAQRKADLEKIKISFEDYYNDNGCYPPQEVLQTCKSDDFQPYLQSVPCDPVTDQSYLYVPYGDDGCGGYRVYAGLEIGDDPIIEALDCDGGIGCGWGQLYNYGIAAGVTVYDSNGDPSVGGGSSGGPVATPSPTAPIYVYACDNSGICNQYEEGHPFLFSCPTTFIQTNCNNECGNPANWCSG